MEAGIRWLWVGPHRSHPCCVSTRGARPLPAAHPPTLPPPLRRRSAAGPRGLPIQPRPLPTVRLPRRRWRVTRPGLYHALHQPHRPHPPTTPSAFYLRYLTAPLAAFQATRSADHHGYLHHTGRTAPAPCSPAIAPPSRPGASKLASRPRARTRRRLIACACPLPSGRAPSHRAAPPRMAVHASCTSGHCCVAWLLCM